MRVFQIQDGFGLEKLVLAERPEPIPGPWEVVFKLRAVTLNYRDLLMVKGLYNPRQPLPLIPLSDGVGEVTAVGEAVTRARIGERIAGNFSQKWISGEPNRTKLSASLGGPIDGMLAEYRVLHEDGVVKVPAHLSDEEAATLPCAALTAWNALVTTGNTKAGDVILLQGTGGVSLFALQFAKMAGARVIITSSSDDKLARAVELGADHTINYRTVADWDKKTKELTDGAGADHIVEVGGAGTFNKSLKAIRIGGTISLIGNLSGNATDVNLISILMQNIRVQGMLVGHREAFEAMNRAIALHRMHPVVDRVFRFEEAPKAFEHMAAGAHFGKICIKF
jgi:NADPH:quinone reductase-like Zn-dependent oxidoreductase